MLTPGHSPLQRSPELSENEVWVIHLGVGWLVGFFDPMFSDGVVCCLNAWQLHSHF